MSDEPKWDPDDIRLAYKALTPQEAAITELLAKYKDNKPMSTQILPEPLKIDFGPHLPYPELLLACSKNNNLALKVKNPDEHILRFAAAADPLVVTRPDFPEALRQELLPQLLEVYPKHWRAFGYSVEQYTELAKQEEGLVQYAPSKELADELNRYWFARDNDIDNLRALNNPTDDEILELLRYSDDPDDVVAHAAVLNRLGRSDARVDCIASRFVADRGLNGSDIMVVQRIGPIKGLLTNDEKRMIYQYMDHPKRYLLTSGWAPTDLPADAKKEEKVKSAMWLMLSAGFALASIVFFVALGMGWVKV